MKDKFDYYFFGIFLFVLIIAFVMFFVFSNGRDSDLSVALWSALTMLVLLFGVIFISLFLRRHRRNLYK